MFRLSTNINICITIKHMDSTTWASWSKMSGLTLLSLAVHNTGTKPDNGSSSIAVRREAAELEEMLMKYDPTHRRAKAALGYT